MVNSPWQGAKKDVVQRKSELTLLINEDSNNRLCTNSTKNSVLMTSLLASLFSFTTNASVYIH